MDEIQKMSGETNFNNLTYCFESPNVAPNFIGFRSSLNIFKGIKNVNLLIKKNRRRSKEFSSKFKWNNIRKSKALRKYQSDAIKNIRNLYNSMQKVIDLFKDYSKIRSEVTHNTKQRRRLKILIFEQMLQDYQ